MCAWWCGLGQKVLNFETPSPLGSLAVDFGADLAVNVELEVDACGWLVASIHIVVSGLLPFWKVSGAGYSLAGGSLVAGVTGGGFHVGVAAEVRDHLNVLAFF